MALYEETKKIQEELNNKYQEDDPLKYMFAKMKLNKQAGIPIPDPEESSAIYGRRDNRNFERFFGQVYDPTDNLEDKAAYRQSGLEQVSYMLPRIATKVASEIAQMPGYVGGLAAWGATGFDMNKVDYLVDNFWQKAIQSAEETMKDQFPVYVKDKVKEGGLMKNILSTSFWATEGADGVGFLLAFLAPGQALKAVKFGAKAARLIKPGNNISKLITKGSDFGTAVGTGATKGAAETFDFVGATVINTLFESAAEGGETFRNVFGKTNDREKAAFAAVDVIKKNFGILLASNAVDQYWLFKDIKMFKRANADNVEKMTKKSILDELIDPKTKKVLSDIKEKSKWAKAGVITKDLLAGIGKEGFYEEGTQFAASKLAEEKSEHPEEDDKGFADELVDLAETYFESLTDTDMQKSIFLGGLLGGGMATVGSVREERAKKRLLQGTEATKPSAFTKFFGAKERKATPGLKQLWERNRTAYHVSLADMAEQTIDEKTKEVIPVTNADGTYKWDPKKVEALAEDKILDYSNKAKLVHFARTGNEEGFKYIKDILDYRYMSLFLNQEGGINTLLRHIDEMAETEKDYFAREGIEFDLETIKKDLKNKALKFQEIHDRVNNTHDLLLDDIKVDKENRIAFNEFSDLVRKNKITEENHIYFANNRIDALRKELSEMKYGDTIVPISTDENNLSDKLVSSLKESYESNKNNLSDASKKHVERIIGDIENHQIDIKKAREYSSKLYSKEWLSKTFKEQIEKKKTDSDSVVDGEKAKEALPLGPKMRALYDKAVIMETISDPIPVTARHSGDIEVLFVDREGKAHKVEGRISGVTKTGNISFRVHKAEETTEKEDGRTIVKYKNVEDNTTYYLNEAETIHYKGEDYEIKDINIVKTPEEVQLQRKNDALLESLKISLKAVRDDLKDIKDKIIPQKEYINELKQRLVDLQNKEAEALQKTGSILTSKGDQRKQLIMLNRSNGKERKKMFMDTSALQKEIELAKQYLVSLQNKQQTLLDNSNRIRTIISESKKDGTYIKSFETINKNYNELLKTAQEVVKVNTESLENSDLYLSRLYSTLKGYYTTFANVLGITNEVNIIRTNNALTDGQKDAEIVNLIANILSTTPLTEEQNELLGTLPTNIERIRTLIATKEQDILDLKNKLAEDTKKLEELKTLTKLYTLLIKNYKDSYINLLSKTLNVLEDIVDEKDKNLETPEDNFSDIRETEKSFMSAFENNYRHPYYGIESWMVSTGEQSDVLNKKDDDLGRWYIFVNNLAHEENNNKYILKSMTIDQVADLDDKDILKKQLKFYAGRINGVETKVTYAQYLTLPQHNKEIVESDIKMVVYEKDGKPLMVSKQVLDNNEKHYVIYNSFLLNKTNRFKEDKFSTKKFRENYFKNVIKIGKKTPTEQQEKDADAYVQEELNNSWNKYLDFREKMMKEPYFFNIHHVNPGVKLYDGAEELSISEAVGDNNIGVLNFSVHRKGSRSWDKKGKVKSKYGNAITRNISGAEHGLRSGYLYLMHNNRFELVKPKTLEETGDVDNIINIIRYLATNPENADEIEQYLHKIIYINAQNPKYKIMFTKFYGKDKLKSGFRSLIFGGKEIMSEDLVEGKNLDDLKTFLSSKYWNFDEKSLRATTFTEYNVSWAGNKPKIISKLWDTSNNSYKGFLFSSTKGNISKGTIYIRKHRTAPLDNARDPQYINQSISLTNATTDYKLAVKKTSDKNKATKDKPEKNKKSKGIPKGTPPPGFTSIDSLRKSKKKDEDDDETEDKSSKKKIKIGAPPPGFAPVGNAKGASNAPRKVTDVFGATPVATTNSLLGKDVDEVSNGTTSRSLYSDEDSLWKSSEYSKELKEMLVKEHGENAKTELFNIYKEEHGIAPFRAITELEEYIQEEFDSRLKWFSDKFPQIPISVVNSILMGNSWGKLTKKGAVLISDIAAEGTIYHEAYHVYSLLFLNEDERKSLYSEVKKRLGKEMSDKQIEEFLAEEFRTYMNSPETYKFNKGQELQKSWFTKLIDYLLSILEDFGIVKPTNSEPFAIENNFKSLEETKIFEIDSDTLSERIANLRSTYSRSRNVSGLTEKETLYCVQDVNYSFFQILFNPENRLDPDTIFDLDVSIKDIYKRLRLKYLGKSHKNNTYKLISDNFDEIVEQHLRFLKTYGINISSRIDDILDEEEYTEDEKGKDINEFYGDSVSIDMNKLIDNPIRLVIAGLPNVSLVNSMPKATLSEFNTYSAVKFSNTLTVLRNSLSKITTLQGMVDKLRSMSDTHPEFTILLNRLGIKDNINKPATPQQINLQNQFFKTFSNNKTIPLLTTYTHDGRKFSMNAMDDNIKQKIRNEWLNNAREIVGLEGSFIYKTKEGAYNVKLRTLKEVLSGWEDIDDTQRDNASVAILQGLGINIEDNSITSETMSNYLFWLNEELKNRTEVLSIYDLYSNDVIRNQAEVNQLLNEISSIYLSLKDLSYFNQDGNREYSITLNSHLSNTTNLLNDIVVDKLKNTYTVPDEVAHLMPWDNKSEEGNLFNRHSIWADYLLSGETLELVLLKGNTTPTEGGEISKLQLGDYKSITFNALLNGISPYLRSADRKLEYGFRIGKPNYSITDDIFKNTMYDYLKDELSTSFALLLDPTHWGGNLHFYSKNAKQLRVFSFLQEAGIPSLEEYIEDHRDKDDYSQDPMSLAVTHADKMVTNFLRTYKKKIDSAFDTYIKDMEAMTKTSLLEDILVKAEAIGDRRGTKRYKVPGIDTEVLEKIGVKQSELDNSISEYDLNRLIRIATYNSFVGNNEQLKLFIGDLAFFKDAKDFHKRTTGASSTKYGQRDDTALRLHLDNEYKRFDGRERTDSMACLVVNDIISSNDKLSDTFKAYDKIEGVNAQSWVTLDEYRDIMLRHGIWYPRHEKTYQWEMQKLAVRLIKLAESGKKIPFDVEELKGQFTSKDGMFYKHTNGIISKVPMYKGNELTESELGVLTILKPQGFGHISNVKGISATQFLKTSSAPIFMSAIEDDSPMFDRVLQMMADQGGLLTFETAEKSEIIGDKKGNLQDIYSDNDYIYQDIRYRDFGIQLDVHEESNGEVSVSTQRTRLEFLDIFNLGESIKKDKKLAENRHEYTEITNDLGKLLRKELLDELGIVYDEETDKYDLPEKNKRKFKDRLINAFESRMLPLNVIDGLELAIDSPLKLLDLSNSKFKIEQVLSALVRNKLIKRKIYGDMLIQESAFLYENPNKNRLLEFYERTFPNGKNKKPVITPMDVMISVPKSMLEYVDSIGGLDVLNTAIAEHNVELLGEDFFTALTMPANRIPAQSLSSVDIIRVVKFLPHYHGNKVVIPAEATTKTGSDFDVDKLTTYFANFVKGKDGKLVITKGKLEYDRSDSIEGKQNRLNEIAIESTIHPERFNELVKPLDSTYLQDSVNEIRKTKPIEGNEIEIRAGQHQLKDVIQWWYNIQKGYEFWKSKSGVAVVAVQNAAHAIEQNHPLELGVEYIDPVTNTTRKTNVFTLFFEGQDLGIDETYKSGFVQDSSKRNISDNFAEFLTAFVDAVKNPFIFEITDDNTFNAIAALNRFGKDASVGIDSIMEFYSQPVVRSMIKMQRIHAAKHMFYNQYNNTRKNKWVYTERLNRAKQYAEVVKRLKKQLKPSDAVLYDKKKNPLLALNYYNTVSSAVEEYIKVRSEVYTKNEKLYSTTNDIIYNTENDEDVVAYRQEIYDRIELYDYKYLSLQDLKNLKEGKLSNDESFKLQAQILDNYMMYNQLGWNVTAVNSYLRPDASSGFGRNLSAIDASIIAPYNTLNRRGIFNMNSILNALGGTKDNPSLIREFFENKQNTPGFYGWFTTIGKSPVIKEFFDREIYSVFGVTGRGRNKQKVEAALENIESGFISFILTRLMGNITKEEMADKYRELFVNDNSIPKQLLVLKSIIKDNLAIRELEPIIAKKNKKTQAISELDNISLFSKQFDTNQWDAIEAEVYDLYNNSTTDNRNFIKNLLLFSLYQSGYKKSPISFSEIIPNRILIPIAEYAFEQFMSQPEGEQRLQLDSFLEQMYRNNTNNKNIVTKHPFVQNNFDAAVEYTDKDEYYKGINYISVDYYLDDPSKYRKTKTKTPMATALLKRVDGNTFRMVSKLGDGMNFSEYYHMLKKEEIDLFTILDSNLERYAIKYKSKEDVDQDNHTENTDEDTEEGYQSPYYKTTSKKTKHKKNRKHGAIESDLNDSYDIGEPNYFAKTLGKETKIHTILRMIINNSEDPVNVAMAILLKDELKKPFDIKIFNSASRDAKENLSPEGEKYNGFYLYEGRKYNDGTIGLYEQLDPKGFERTALHEGIHALTISSYYTNRKFMFRIDNLISHVRNYVNNTPILDNIDVNISLQDLNNIILSDPKEFISYGLTNYGFEKLLNAIPAFNEDNIKDLSTSIFRQFLESIYELFESFFARHPEIKNNLSYSSFTELLSVVDDVITKPNEDIMEYLSDDASAADIEGIRQNYSISRKTQEEGKKNNEYELNKEKTDDFALLYPEYSYLTDIEQQAFQEAVDKGEIQLACGL